MIELESKKRMESLKQSIETATGESYENLTGAFKAMKEVVDKYKFFYKNLRTISFVENRKMTEVPVIDCVNFKSLASTFYACTGLKVVTLRNTQNITNFKDFIYNTYIETIGILDFSGVTNASGVADAFRGNSSITNIEFVPETIHFSVSIGSTKLTAESVQSIAGGLAFVTTAQTLTISKNVPVTEEQKATISNKGWTLVQK